MHVVGPSACEEAYWGNLPRVEAARETSWSKKLPPVNQRNLPTVTHLICGVGKLAVQVQGHDIQLGKHEKGPRQHGDKRSWCDEPYSVIGIAVWFVRDDGFLVLIKLPFVFCFLSRARLLGEATHVQCYSAFLPVPVLSRCIEIQTDHMVFSTCWWQVVCAHLKQVRVCFQRKGHHSTFMHLDLVHHCVSH